MQKQKHCIGNFMYLLVNEKKKKIKTNNLKKKKSRRSLWVIMGHL